MNAGSDPESPASAAEWLRPPERALLIGINDYDAPWISPLRGCVADCRAVEALLRERLGMGDGQLRLLLSPAAPEGTRPTRAAIIEGIRDFLGAAPAGSEVLLYFSGHGSRSSLSAEIAFGDQWGEGWVPCDARVGGVRDLLDRELRLLFEGLADRGIRLTLIADSCHAGGTWRGAVAEAAIRTAPDEKAPRTLASLLDGSVSLDQIERSQAHELAGMVALAAAQPTEKAWEASLPGADGTAAVRGAMTTALLATLDEARGPLTLIELLRGLRARLAATARARQMPLLDGPWEGALFGGEPPPRAQPLFAVSALAADGSITIEGGQLDGIRPDAAAQSWRDYTLTPPSARWLVRSVGPRSATLAPIGGATAQVGQPVQVALVEGLTVTFGARRARLSRAWEEISDGLLREVRRGASDYRLDIERGDYVTRRRDGSVVRRAPLSARSEPYESLRHLNRLACYDAFVARRPTPEARLSLPIGAGAAGGLSLSASWEGPGGSRQEAAFGAGAHAAAAGATLRLTLTNQSAAPLYAMLYRLDEACAEVEALWPPNGGNELEPQGTVELRYRLPSEARLAVRLLVSDRPHPMPRLPCGPVQRLRGEGAPRDLGPILGTEGREGGAWAVVDELIGQP